MTVPRRVNFTRGAFALGASSPLRALLLGAFETRSISNTAACAYRELNPAVLMMKSAEDRLSSELAEPLDRPMTRGILTQG
jgi:hypothetical protein